MIRSRRPVVCLVALAAALAGAADVVLAASPRRRTPIVEAVEKARLSVVNISTEEEVQVRYTHPFFGDDVFEQLFREFFREEAGPRRRVRGPLGSGVIIDRAGYVVTNEHVVRRASNIQLSLPDGTTYDAELIAADPGHDIALLRIVNPGNDLKPITMGTSSDLMLGETVIAVGNPFGFENSVTSGIVSALGRSLTIGEGPGAVRYEDLIQTSALINPGNSGGALLNIEGELIGINTAVVGGAQGIGFAIPIDRVRDYLDGLFLSPNVSACWFGASLQRAPDGPGALVAEVEPKGPAAQAGLREGDVVTAADGAPVRDPYALARRIAAARPGDTLALAVRRASAERRLAVMLAAWPVLTPAEILQKRLGLAGQDVTPVLARALGLAVRQGVLVTEVERNGPAAQIGVERGDVIIQLGAQRVASVADLAALLRTAQGGERTIIVIVRGRVRAYGHITLR